MHAILKIIVKRKTVLNPRHAADDKENSECPNNVPELVVTTSSALNLVDLVGSENVGNMSRRLSQHSNLLREQSW